MAFELEKVLCFCDNGLNLLREIMDIATGILVVGSQRVKEQLREIVHFPTGILVVGSQRVKKQS